MYDACPPARAASPWAVEEGDGFQAAGSEECCSRDAAGRCRGAGGATGTVWLSRRKIGEAVVVLAFAYLFCSGGRKLFEVYPASYTWSELLIDYQGGFVRRGLLGEVAFDLRNLVRPALLLTGLVVALYVGSTVALVRLSRRAAAFPAFCFLLSPAGFLFPVYDPEAFGRKDIVIVASLLFAAALSVRRGGRVAFATILLTYGVVGFVIETAWLYLPLVAALFARTAGRDWTARQHAALWTATVTTLVVCFAITLATNQALRDPAAVSAQRDAIAASWGRMVPGATLNLGALQYLGLSPVEGIVLALHGQGARSTALGYAVAFVLANLPVLSHILRSRSARPGMDVATWLSFAAMSSTFLIGADWGRYTHLWAIHAFVFGLLTRDRPAREPPIRRGDLLPTVMAVLLYGATWRIKHYAWDGDSALVPGAMFVLLRATPR